jgi:transposase
VTGRSCKGIAGERISAIEKKKLQGKSCRGIAEITGISKSRAAEIVKEWQKQLNTKDSN